MRLKDCGILLVSERTTANHHTAPDLANMVVNHFGDLKTPASFLPSPTQCNVIVGPNNGGKSRILRSLYSQALRAVHPDDVGIATKLDKLTRTIPPSERMLQPAENDLWACANHIKAFFSYAPHAIGGGGMGPFSLTPTLHGMKIDVEVRILREQKKGYSEAGLKWCESLLGLASSSLTESDTWTTVVDLRARALDAGRASIFVPPLRGHWRFRELLESKDQGLGVGAGGYDDPLMATYCESFGWDVSEHHWYINALRVFWTGNRLYETVEFLNGVTDENTWMRDEFEASTRRVLDEMFGFKNSRLVASNQARHNERGNFSKVRPLAIHCDAFKNGQPVQLLGDGVTSALTIAVAPLIARKESLVLIDEPEQHLHPGQQRKLAKFLVEECRKRDQTLYVATHSPYFLDALAESIHGDELTVLRVEKGLNSSSAVTVYPSATVADLESLGATVNALLATSMLAVEGPTDVKYIKSLLALAPDNALQEDRDYTFVVYGGSLLEVGFLQDSAKAMPLAHYACVIADEDSKKAAKHKRLRDWVAIDASRRCYCTTAPAREIENLFIDASWFREMLAARRIFLGKRPVTAALKLTPAQKKSLANEFVERVLAGKIQWSEVPPDAQRLATSIIEAINGFLALAR